MVAWVRCPVQRRFKGWRFAVQCDLPKDHAGDVHQNDMTGHRWVEGERRRKARLKFEAKLAKAKAERGK